MQSTNTDIRVVGFDPSLRNWGIATGLWNIETNQLTIQSLDTVTPQLPSGKQVRKNSLDLESARQLFEKALLAAKGAQAVFVECPEGSQSARAMASYGICMGVLGSLRFSGVPMYELSPTQVKIASVGSKTATKKQVIEWASTTHPEASWPTYKRNGAILVSETVAEHMADAVAAIHAGLQTPQFKQMLSFIYPNLSQ